MFAYQGTSAFRSFPASRPGTGPSAAGPASPTAPWWGEAQAARRTKVFPSVPCSGLLKIPCGEEKSREMKEIPPCSASYLLFDAFSGGASRNVGVFSPRVAAHGQSLCPGLSLSLHGAAWRWGGSRVPVSPHLSGKSHSNLCPPLSSILVPPVLISLGVSPPGVMGRWGTCPRSWAVCPIPREPWMHAGTRAPSPSCLATVLSPKEPLLLATSPGAGSCKLQP